MGREGATESKWLAAKDAVKHPEILRAVLHPDLGTHGHVDMCMHTHTHKKNTQPKCDNIETDQPGLQFQIYLT